MFLALSQIITSLQRLHEVHPFFGYAFLGFKKKKLPIGNPVEFSYKFIKDEILYQHFKIGDQPGYFNPFKSTTRWVSERYESTSLQRIIADTFSGAFDHKKGTSEWAWREDYVTKLANIMRATKTSKIPLLDLSVWLYRKQQVPEGDARSLLVARFKDEFSITDVELESLFDTFIEGRSLELATVSITDVELLNKLGWPRGAREKTGVVLKRLFLSNVGPAREIEYESTQRVNLITGDNSLGKTFLLDCAWWAITGLWMGYTADPLTNESVSRAEIGYTLRSGSGREEQFVAPFNVLEWKWQRPSQPMQGLALHTNYSGSFAIWDPAQAELTYRRTTRGRSYLFFDRDQIWNGLVAGNPRQKPAFLSNGLIRDWVTWQRASREYRTELSAFEAALGALSPPEGNQLRSGEIVKLADDTREIPTIRMPYGDVPVVYASAGIQRILSLAYMLVWSWFRHVELSRATQREPLQSIIVLIDEIESHLHPRWQRQIVPALLEAVHRLAPKLSVQWHISTHSPLVLASLEPLFDREVDRIHHLILRKGQVTLRALENWKHGSIDYWLESEVFGLKEARSKPAEQILERATALQLQHRPSKKQVELVHQRLVRLLPDDDPFWVRWGYFYKKFGKSK